MEEILDLYQQPYDPKRPLVCLDESNKQLTIEVREPIPIEPGKPERYDTEYEHNACKSAMEWRFTTKDARIKLKKLYPELPESTCTG